MITPLMVMGDVTLWNILYVSRALGITLAICKMIFDNTKPGGITMLSC